MTLYSRSRLESHVSCSLCNLSTGLCWMLSLWGYDGYPTVLAANSGLARFAEYPDTQRTFATRLMLTHRVRACGGLVCVSCICLSAPQLQPPLLEHGGKKYHRAGGAHLCLVCGTRQGSGHVTSNRQAGTQPRGGRLPTMQTAWIRAWSRVCVLAARRGQCETASQHRGRIGGAKPLTIGQQPTALACSPDSAGRADRLTEA